MASWDPLDLPVQYLPSLIVFDIDYTIWPLWIDTHSYGPPFKYVEEGNMVLDCRGVEIKPFKDIVSIFQLIQQFPDTQIGVASRTEAPEYARQVLSLLRLSSTDTSTPTTFASVIAHSEIYPGSKLTHFRQLAKKTGVDYQDMIFFDDEPRNQEVARLGVTFVLVDEDEGVTMEVFLEALRTFAREVKRRDGVTV